MTEIVKRSSSELARPTRRSFLKAVATLVAATAAAKVLEPLEAAAQRVPEFNIGGQRVVLGDWVESAKYDTVKVRAEAQAATANIVRIWMHGLMRPAPTAEDVEVYDRSTGATVTSADDVRRALAREDSSTLVIRRKRA